MNILDIAIAKKLAGGGGGSGTDNYNDLSNLPKINDTTLSGNKSSSALGLQSEIKSDSMLASDLVDDTNQDNKFVTSTEKNTWNGKQNAIDSDHKLSSSLVSFTEAEAAALASGINSSKVGQISTNQTNILYTVNKVGKNLFNPDSLSNLYNMAVGVNAYTYQSTETDTNTSFRFRLQVFNESTAGAIIYSKNNVTTGILAVPFTKTASFNIIRFGNSGASKDAKISINVSNLENDKDYILAINVTAANPSVSLAWTDTMICTAEIYAQSPEFNEYALPNSSLTAGLIDAIDNDAKNKFEMDAANVVSSSETNYSVTGSTFQITASKAWSFTTFAINDLDTTKTYVLSYRITAESHTSESTKSEIRIAPTNTGADPIDYRFITGTGTYTIEFAPTSSTMYLVMYANPSSNSSLTNSFTVTDVMICTKAEYDISPNYVPFALSNPILTPALIECVDNGAKNKFNPEKATPDGFVTDGNGYAFKSILSDTRTILKFVLLAYNDNTIVRLLDDADITSTGLFSFTFVKGPDFNFLRFGHSGEVYDLKVAVDVSNLEDGETYVLSFNVTATNPSVLIAWNSTMICTKAKWDVSHNFEPYVLPNPMLTAALVEQVDEGAKNLWDFANANITAGGGADRITYVKTANSLTLTAVSTWAFVSYDIALKKGTYYFYGLISGLTGTDSKCVQICVNGYQGTVIKRIDITANGAISDSFVVDTDRTITISLYASEGEYTSSAFTISNLMICSEADWNVSQNFAPYALPNTDLTQLEAEDRAALAEVVDSGSKNLIKVDISKIISNNPTLTWNGNVGTSDDGHLTFTVNEADGTISVQSDGSNAQYQFSLVSEFDSEYYTVGKRYVISGCPSGGSQYTYDLRAWIGSTYYIDRGEPFAFTCAVNKLKIDIVIRANQTINDTFKPMICSESEWNISTKFVPHSIKQPQTKISYFNVTTANTYEKVSDLAFEVPAGRTVNVIATAYRSSNTKITGIQLQITDTQNDENIIAKHESNELNRAYPVTALYMNNGNTPVKINVYIKSEAAITHTVGIWYTII